MFLFDLAPILRRFRIFVMGTIQTLVLLLNLACACPQAISSDCPLASKFRVFNHTSVANNEVKTPKSIFAQSGIASWYRGKTTAGAAHRHLPLGTYVRVTNLANDKSAVVKINDRGPFIKGRIIDVSKEAARELAMLNSGTARVRIEVLSPPQG